MNSRALFNLWSSLTMIKQTSGAISFLLAAYRAILKKNFLLALIAATSLSVSGNTLAYTLDQDKSFTGDNAGIDQGSRTELSGRDDAVIRSGVTLKITTNAKLDTNRVMNEGKIILTNGSVLDGSTIQNKGDISVDHSSFIHEDIVNHGTVEIKGTSAEKTYIFDGSTYTNNEGTFTLDHVKQVGSPASGEDGKYNVTTSQKTNGADTYTSYDLTKDSNGKTLNQIFGSGKMAEDGEGSTLMVFVNGGTFNIKNSELMTAQGDDDGYWDLNNSSSGYAHDREYGNDQSASVQPGLVMPAHEKKLSEILGHDATCTEANHNAAIAKLKEKNHQLPGEDDHDYLERLNGMLYDGTGYSELVVTNGTLNIEKSTTNFNYVTQNGGTINVTDSKLKTYDDGVLDFKKGTLNIKATGEGKIAGSSDPHSEVGYVDSSSNKGSIIKVGKSASVTFEGFDENALAIINAKSLTNEGTFVFKNQYYKINTLSEAFDFNNSGTATIDGATADNLKTTNLKNADNGILNINTGTAHQVEIKSIASTGGVINAKYSNIKTSDVALSGNTIAKFGKLESSGTIKVGSATDGAAQVHIDELVAGNIQADPDWSNPSLVSVAQMGTDGTTTVGDIKAGRNSAVVFGSRSNTEAASLVNQAGGLNENGTQAMLYLNKPLKVKDGTGIAIDGTTETPPVTNNALTLGNNSALVLGESLVTAALKTAADGTSGSDTAALTFANGSGTVNYTDSSKVILDSTNVQLGSTYRIFEDTTILTNTDTGSTKQLYVTSRNNNIKATVGRDGVTTQVEQNYSRDTLKGMSAAVYDTADAAMCGGSGNGISFLSSVVGNSLRNGQEAESAARLAQFGGVYQNALMASSVLDEAVNTRLGIASTGSHFMYTDNALGTGMWIAPIYKQHTSDSFDSDGLDYGARIRMSGVSLGGDYSFANNLRAGVAVTIGKSDIDGKESADSANNDSSFYGFALYGGYKYDAFSLAADIGYTKIKNSIDYETGLDGFGKISADADVTAYHAATTAQYEFDLGRLALTPHAGLRFVSFDVDDYKVDSASGAIANTENERVNIFSIPVGVTLSHEFTNGDWRVKPAADIRVTVNTGDTDIDYMTRFIGASADTKLNADIIDTVTYGVELGLAASYQKNLSFGVSANYTGSSEAKEFGFNLSSRYAF